MIDRKEFAEELTLRKHIREAIKVVKKRKAKSSLHEEKELRLLIRDLLKEGSPAVADEPVHSNTGINALEDLFKNSNILSTLRQGYKSLTTRKKTDPPTGPTKQRTSYMNHILNAVDSALETEESIYKAVHPNAPGLQEDINIAIEDDAAAENPAFIDVEKKEPSEEEEVDKFSIEGQDKTGRNRAFTDFKNIDKNLITAYDNLDDPEDRTMFKDYLLTNLKLYFERFEEELPEDLPPPDIKMPAGAEMATAEEEEVLSLIHISEPTRPY